jgi:hypothetical protein
MAAGQNDDIDPASATGRVAAASRARSAAGAQRRADGAPVTVGDTAAEPGRLQGSTAGRERVRDDHLGAGPDVCLVDALHHVGLVQIRPGAPRHLIHRHALSLQLTTHAAVDDHYLTIGQPPEDQIRHAHSQPLPASGLTTSHYTRQRAKRHSPLTGAAVTASQQVRDL